MKRQVISTKVICRAVSMVNSGQMTGPHERLVKRWISAATAEDVHDAINGGMASGHLDWDIEADCAVLTDRGEAIFREWLIVVTKSNFGAEAKVRFGLRSMGYSAWYPESEKAEKRGDKIERVRRPLFTRLVFVMRETGMDFGKIQNTRGVAHIMAVGEKYCWMLDSDLDGVRQKLNADGIYVLDAAPEKPKPRTWVEGQAALIAEGPFAGWVGMVEGLHLALPDDQVTLLLDSDGKKVRVSVRDAILTAPEPEAVRIRQAPKIQKVQRLGA